MEGGSNSIRPAPGSPGETSSAAVGSELVDRHFLLNDRCPAGLDDVDPRELDPFLRGLLFTDGTVTRTLEVKALSRVRVTVIDQTSLVVGDREAEGLEAAAGTDAVRRRVAIGAEGSEPRVWAESHILPERLPPGFLAVLGGARDGIGESLQAVELESRREMLWMGLCEPPAWASSASPAITRCYRVVAGGSPALLITECFAVERREGAYRLRWPS